MAARGGAGANRDAVQFALDGPVARIRVPARIDRVAAQALCDAAEEIEYEDRIGLVVVSGGAKAFNLGVEDPGQWQDRFDWVGAIGSLTRPVVAALQGDAVAEGCELALACDLRYASATSGFRLPQVAEGRLPRYGATVRLPRIIGRQRALELLLDGRRIGSPEAMRMGLVTRVAPAARFRAMVEREVGALAAKGPLALRLAKEAIVKGLDMTFDQGMRFEQDLYVLLQTTRDRAEGIRAFRGKRPPRFRGE